MHVTAIATISLDGRITPPGAEGTAFASRETGENFLAALLACDVTVTGRTTYEVEKARMLGMRAAMPYAPVSVVMTRDPAAHRDPALPADIEFTDLGPAELLAELAGRGLDRVLVVGGGGVYAAFAAARVVDEWVVVVEPVLLGGGTPLFAEVAEQQLSLREHRLLNAGTVLLHYDVVR